ncbi:MAG: TolC family protein [Leptospiraceae bacterium]|nr:TolC family protein [Leptospiraceae bacterium]
MKNIIFTVVLLFLSHCASPPPVRVNDNLIEPDILAATGIPKSEIEKMQTREELGLEAAYVMAVERTERLAIGVERIEQARRQYDIQFSQLLPTVSARGNILISDQAAQLNSIGQGSGLRFFAQQRILTGLDEYAGFQAAKQSIRLMQTRLAFDAGELYRQLAVALTQHATITKSLDARKEVLDILRSMERELGRRVRLGRSRNAELLALQTRIARTEAELQSLELQLSEVASRLRLATGVQKPVTWQSPELADFVLPSQEQISQLVEARYDIQAAQALVELQGARRLMAEGSHLPSIFLTGNYRVRTEPDFRGPDFIGNLVAEFPIFEGGATEAAAEEARSVERESVLTLNQLRRVNEEELRQAMEARDRAAQQESAFENARQTAERTYLRIRYESNLNLVTNLEVLSVLSDLQTAREQHEHAVLQTRLRTIEVGVSAGLLPKREGRDQ